VLGVLPGTIGTIQATEAIKLLLGIGSPLVGKLLLYNALDMSFEYVKLKKNPKCPVCGENPTITELIDYEAFCGMPGHDHEGEEKTSSWDIDVFALDDLLNSGNKPFLLDVREPHELEISQLPGAKNIPLGTLAARLSELDTAQEMVVFCKSGGRSQRALELLTSVGFKKVKNLKGGINAWAQQIDSDLPVY
jgi:adenylyltransferase/sulfurtransferase